GKHWMRRESLEKTRTLFCIYSVASILVKHVHRFILQIFKSAHRPGHLVEEDRKAQPAAAARLDIATERAHAADVAGLAEDAAFEVGHAFGKRAVLPGEREAFAIKLAAGVVEHHGQRVGGDAGGDAIFAGQSRAVDQAK